MLRKLPIALAAALLMAPAGARAGWSAPVALPGSTAPFRTAIATDGRGDTVVAWAIARARGRPPTIDSAVRLALLPAGGVRAVTHTVWSRPRTAVGGVAVALDRRGELTVAWIDQADRRGTVYGHKTVRAAFRTASGRWSAVQAVGRSSPFNYAHVWLSASPDRRVLLSWDARVRAAPGVAVAWRVSGRAFGPVVAASRSPGGAIFDPQTLFDAAGTAYLYGTVDCDRPSSRGVLLRAAPGRRGFGAPVVVASAPSKSLSLSVTGAGVGAAAWLRQSCSTTEDLDGPVAARTLRGAALGPVQPLGDPAALATTPTAVAGADGGASIGWLGSPQTSPDGVPYVSMAGPDGAFGPPLAPADGLVPVAVDGGGDRLLAHLTFLADEARAAVLPPGADAPDPAPVTSAPWLATAVAAPIGRGAAVAWLSGDRLLVSTWAP